MRQLSESNMNYYIHLKNNESSEQLNIFLYKPVGVLNRCIGTMTVLYPAIIPVGFKCTCFESYKKMEINEKVLQQVLKLDDKEWNNKLLAVEAYQINLFYSDVIFR